MIVIAIVNSKGGVGKSTISVHLGHALALAGKRTLIVDMDIQENIRIWFDAGQKEITLFEILVEGKKASEAITNVRENLDIIPSGGDNLGAVPYLLNLGIQFSGLSGNDRAALKKILQKIDMQWIFDLKNVTPEILKKSLYPLKNTYDFILIDCSPSRTLLHTIAAVASDHVMVPVSMEWLSVVGSAQVGSAISEVREKYGLSTDISFVVPTFVDRRRSRVCQEVNEDLAKMYGDKVTSPIRVNGKLSEAPSWGKTVFDLADRRGMEDFKALAKRVIQNG
ncbi:ParA family protein [Pelotomaculum terephthalicicum JT]|uniref:ParA family protein n=1 Tax=Pelotomaculum terephthalicicum TaxID=206393 RepID=UPI001F040873|nr:ParA family protein [Pelotomaculum terephthalicicum]MCG9969600.1 ParA family protein [Pelotomaculum terephthalicicum JT]